MLQAYESVHFDDEKGYPAGGKAQGCGMVIDWQDGPLGGKEPNGAFVETVLHAVLHRLSYYQESRFECRENALAITKLEEALHWLDARTHRRKMAGMEGTHEGS